MAEDNALMDFLFRNPRIALKKMYLEPHATRRVPELETWRIDDGTLFVAVASWGTDSDFGTDLALWWPALASLVQWDA